MSEKQIETEPIERKERPWLAIELEDEEKEQKLIEAFSSAHQVRMWAMDELRRRWDAVQGTAKVTDLLMPMTRWVKEMDIHLQHYTLVTVLNETVARFNQSIRVDHSGIGGQVAVVQMENPWRNLHPEDFGLVVQSRVNWPRHLKETASFSTTYGYLYLQGEWQETLAEQARAMEVQQKLFYYLIYAATIRRFTHEHNWNVQFSIHDPNNQFGRSRKAKGRKELARR